MKLLTAVVLAGSVSSAFAADYSLRTECARLNQTYSENRSVETVAGIYAHRFGNDTAVFKLKGDSSYVAAARGPNPHTVELLTKAHEMRRPVNLCIRSSDGYIFGAEVVN